MGKIVGGIYMKAIFLKDLQIQDKLIELIKSSKRLDIMVAFVGKNANELFPYEELSEINSIRILCNLSEKNIKAGATNPSTLKFLYQMGNVTIKNNQAIHAKCYIFDNKHLIITSANFSKNAFKHNLETGIYLSDPKAIKDAHNYFIEIWDDKNSKRIIYFDPLIKMENRYSKKTGKGNMNNSFSHISREIHTFLWASKPLEVKQKDLIKYYFKIFLKMPVPEDFKKYDNERTLLEFKDYEYADYKRNFNRLLSKNNIKKNINNNKIFKINGLRWGMERSKTNFLKNGPDKIIKEINNFLYIDNSPLEIKFEKLMNNLRYAGTSLPSTLLCLKNPQEFTIWNKMTEKAFKILGIKIPKGTPGQKYKVICAEEKRIQKITGLESLYYVDEFLEQIARTLSKI